MRARRNDPLMTADPMAACPPAIKGEGGGKSKRRLIMRVAKRCDSAAPLYASRADNERGKGAAPGESQMFYHKARVEVQESYSNSNTGTRADGRAGCSTYIRSVWVSRGGNR